MRKRGITLKIEKCAYFKTRTFRFQLGMVQMRLSLEQWEQNTCHSSIKYSLLARTTVQPNAKSHFYHYTIKTGAIVF